MSATPQLVLLPSKTHSPLVLKYFKGTLCLAHNGNLVNAFEMRRQLEETGAIFQTTMDSEVIAFHIARERLAAPTAEEAIKRTAAKTRGAYALIISSPRKLIGVRDPFGLRPLCLGKKGNVWIMASESCAITSVGGEFIRDIEPGEIVTITRDGVFSDKSLQQEKRAHCVFEYIYFARLDSHIDDVSVYEAKAARRRGSRTFLPCRCRPRRRCTGFRPDRRRWDMRRHPAFHMRLFSIKIAMSAEPSSNRPRKNAKIASVSSLIFWNRLSGENALSSSMTLSCAVRR